MDGLIALVGGDEFRPGCEVMDTYLLEAVKPRPAMVLIIPTAAAAENPSKAASDGVRHFSRLSAQASELMVLDGAHANNEALCDAISQATHVYFTGGNPNHLLDVLRDSLLLQRLTVWLAGGGVLAGSSAGAMVMGSSMRRPGEGQWIHGLGLVEGVAVLPHHEGRDPASVAKGLKETAVRGLAVLGIDARTCCVGGRDDWRVIGVGKVTLYRDGEWQTFNSGESLPPGF